MMKRANRISLAALALAILLVYALLLPGSLAEGFGWLKRAVSASFGLGKAGSYNKMLALPAAPEVVDDPADRADNEIPFG